MFSVFVISLVQNWFQVTGITTSATSSFGSLYSRRSGPAVGVTRHSKTAATRLREKEWISGPLTSGNLAGPSLLRIFRYPPHAGESCDLLQWICGCFHEGPNPVIFRSVLLTIRGIVGFIRLFEVHPGRMGWYPGKRLMSTFRGVLSNDAWYACSCMERGRLSTRFGLQIWNLGYSRDLEIDCKLHRNVAINIRSKFLTCNEATT